MHARGIITTNEQQDKRKGINKNLHSCIKHPTRRKTTSLLVLLYIFIGPILADIIIYKSSIIKFYRCRAEDTRPYFRFTVDTFSRWFNTFLDLNYASPALMFSIKIRSAFEKCLRFSFFMSDFLLAKGKPFQGMQD